MSAQREATLEVSFPKALLLTAFPMLCFVAALYLIGLRMRDPLVVGFLVVMVIGMTVVFAACISFMLRCRIRRDGLCPAVPAFYRRVLRWGDVAVVSKRIGSPFYVVRSRDSGAFCILPCRFLLKHPESLKQLIEQYAPADNIVRRELAV